MNTIVAAINLIAALFWVVVGQPHGVAISLLGVYCSVVADRWIREYRS